MEKMDFALLGFFQKISDWFQEWFGRDNFFLARACVLLYILGYGIYIGSIILLLGMNSWLFMYILCCFFVSFIFSKGIDSLERICRENPKFKNPGVIGLRTNRILSMFWIIFAISSLLDILRLVFNQEYVSEVGNKSHLILLHSGECLEQLMFFVIPFFACCTPKPRKPSKVKKLVEKASELLAPQMQPA
ncbi:MAG: hypothetical protein WC795_02995 [Candidatus Paceibacterota bacterium]|jgi:hypothetical protein